MLNGARAVGSVVAALDQERFQSGFRQRERREQARAAGAHHHGSKRGAGMLSKRGGVGGGILVHNTNAAGDLGVRSGNDLLLVKAVAQAKADAYGEMYVAFLARVDGRAVQLAVRDVRGRQRQQAGGFAHSRFEGRLFGGAFLEGNLDLGNLYHGELRFICSVAWAGCRKVGGCLICAAIWPCLTAGGLARAQAGKPGPAQVVAAAVRILIQGLAAGK